jgi:hypothetical protein
MRKSTSIINPLFAVITYYGVLAGLVVVFAALFPAQAHYLPFGGIDALIGIPDEEEIIATFVNAPEVASQASVTLAAAIVGALLLMVPISWVYFITTRAKQVDRSFAQTIVVLPVIVAGIAMIVQDNLALAFSLAGVVAAVRFRFSLEEPAHALYVFAAIGVGLGAGIGALGIAYVTSVAFVLVNLVLWKLDYGANLTTPFFSFLTGRGRDDKDL